MLMKLIWKCSINDYVPFTLVRFLVTFFMPQLGPINWLFLYIFFWAVVSVVCVVVWWDGRKGYKISGAKKSVKDYVWKW